VFAFLPSLGYQEMFLLVVIGLLLYGRNLPQAGRTLGRFVAQMKRGFQDFKDQMDRDESLREVKQTLEQTRRELQNVTALPRAVRNPAGALRELANDAMQAPTDDDTHATPAEVGTAAHGDDVADEPAPPTASPDAAPNHTTPKQP
jgi:Sec-independent protein translocase protein TatA